MLAHGMPTNAVIDSHAARLLDVNFAIGTPDALKSLITDPEVLAAARRRAEAIAPELSAPAKEWLAVGQHGISSMTIFQRLTGKQLSEDENHPSDPDDLGRCRRLLEQVPELKPRMGELVTLSPVWEKLVTEWDALCSLMDKEAPNWRDGKGSAPKTYDRMKQIGC